MQLLISKSDMARRRGVDPSAISKAVRPGGALRSAVVGGRIDRAHPDALRWLGDPHIEDTAMGVAEWANAVGVPVADVQRALQPGNELAAAAIHPGHVSLSGFAALSGISIAMLFFHLDNGDLRAAVTSTRRIDIAHPVALALFARHPFKRDAKGDPIAPDFDLSPACVGDDIDVDHPIARVFLARCLGRVVTDADLGAA